MKIKEVKNSLMFQQYTPDDPTLEQPIALICSLKTPAKINFLNSSF